ncbi:hypothetical protein KDI_09110 [Dictyobacter arantiisoli]|uniref:DUF2335 domain-containing protein n=1 Tax=Dictyobacter arantiisoli TaxID=2014874 RepID=A0A5A5T7G4_9CHLR|nr:hypothetical protein KDI_09110 [Dictyobacter arantiisoli]
MKQYPDPQEHFNNYLERAVKTYADGLQKANLEPSPILDRAMSRRISKGAREDYEEQSARVLLHNLNEIEKKYKPIEDQVRRSNARARTIICPFAILFFICASWYAFGHKDSTGVIMGTICVIFALIFFAIWVTWALIDRPVEIKQSR